MKNKIKKKLDEQKTKKENNKNTSIIKEIDNNNKDKEIKDYKKVFEMFDKFPNENLFKSIQYSLNERLEFQNKEDKFRFLSLIINISYYNFLFLLFFLYFRFFLSNLHNYYMGKTFYAKTLITHLISFFISYIILKKKKRAEKSIYRYIVKIIFDINHLVFIYFNYNSQNDFSKMYEFIYNGISYIILIIKLKYIIYSIINITIILFISSEKKIIILNFCKIIYGIAFSIINVYSIKKFIKYLWILYDSFKRSFLIFNNLLENNFCPIFIVSKNMDILYCNKEGKKFINNIIGEKIDSRKEFKIEINFKKIIPEILNDLFFELLENSLNSNKEVSNFYFPFIFHNEKLTNLEYKKHSNYFLFSGELNKLNWYNIICEKCIWKVYHCYYLNLIPCDDYLFINNIFNEQIKILLDKYELFIDNTNKICEIILKCEKISKVPNSTKRTSKKFIFSLDKNFMNDNSIDKDMNNVFPKMDFSILFFFKNQSEVLFDLLLTQNIYFCFLNKRKEIEKICEKEEINLYYFTKYFSLYFDYLLTSKNFSLEFKIKENCRKIIIHEKLLRITMFNILLFILSNSKSNTNKKIIVCSIRLSKEKNYHSKSLNNFSLTNFLGKKRSLKSEKKIKELKTNQIFSLEFDISISGDSLLDYNKINKILKTQKIKDSFLKTEIVKSNLNIGILTVYNIITQFYKKEFTMNSNEKGNIVSFKLTCEKEVKINYNDEENQSCHENFYFYDQYFHDKIMNKIYENKEKYNIFNSIKINNDSGNEKDFIQF